jgi:actin-related protein
MEIPVFDITGLPNDPLPDSAMFQQAYGHRQGHSIVIDNGSNTSKVGWSHMPLPYKFKNVATTNKTGRILVGPEVSEKQSVRSPFEKNIV